MRLSGRSLIALLAAAAPALLAQQPIARAEGGNVALAAGKSRRAPSTTANAMRLAGAAPELDGRDGDAAWANAQVIDDFLQYEPTTGAVPRFRTELRVVYDDRYLYVLARMFDPAPDSIISLLSRRDVRTNSEQLKLVIDSYHDRRTAYQFIVNPAGVKRDFYVYNDNTEDVTWDAVWDAATAIDDKGWVAEFRIPFSQLRFPRDQRTFGLLAVRDVARTGERISWPLYDRNKQGYVSQGGTIGGFDGIPTPRRLEIAPYAVARSETRPSRMQSSGYAQLQGVAAGADLKYGLTSNLTLDATINPDFGQVEADPSVLNLSAFEQFFEERRPFFLEGAGTFSYRTSCNDIDTGCRGLFYSRRVGRAPQLGGLYRDPENPTFSTILTAAKVTGRNPNGLSIGFLDAVTQKELNPRLQTIEPATNYLVGRVLQDVRGGQSSFGAMVTATNRALDVWTEPYLRSAAYTGGVDARHRFGNRNYEFYASVSGSLVQGDRRAITLLQTDGVHRFQRPDDDLEVDTTATSLVGSAQRLSISKFGGGITRFQTVLQRFSPGFETNDLGFQPRADENLFRNWFSVVLNEPTSLYRRAQMNFNANGRWNDDGLHLSNHLNFNWNFELPNLYWLFVGASSGDFGATYDDRVARGGPAVRNSRFINAHLGMESDRRKPLGGGFFGSVYRGDDGESHSVSFGPSLEFRASSRFSTSLSVNYSEGVTGAQWLRNAGASSSDTTHYLFARLDQKTVRMSTRINLTATPTLSLQLWAQPFVTNGTFSDLKELSNPSAERFNDRFRPYAGNPGTIGLKELRSNTVLRWEYRPGSVLFLVWQQGRSDGTPPTEAFDFRRDVSNVFGLHPRSTFLIKASYWLNP